MDFPFTTDGCSMFPDGDYGGCCVQHDRAYWAGGSAMARLEADMALMQCVACRHGVMLAVVMFIGVRVGGAPWWPLPWRWGYGWRYRKAWGYKRQQAAIYSLSAPLKAQEKEAAM